jgi:soluble lytic murein transglycosylase-like protein
MGLEIIPIAGIALLILLSQSQPTNANYVGQSYDGVGLNIEYVYGNEQKDRNTIYNYVTSRYPKISSEDANLIADSLIDAGREHQVDPKFTAALIARESAFNKEAISSTGAKGLGQIKDFNFPSLNIQDPFDIRQNAKGTTQYLKSMLERWKAQSGKVALSLASYFKGPNAVAQDQGRLDEKSQAYVRDILKIYDNLKSHR